MLTKNALHAEEIQEILNTLYVQLQRKLFEQRWSSQSHNVSIAWHYK